MSGYRKILHLDLDAFFCAVEVLRDPSLDGKPFAVGGTPEGRGVVSSCSYAARKYGVRSAMPMAQALRLCPGLIPVTHHGGYGSYSKKVMDLLDTVTPYVEQISIDEAFIDVTDIDAPSESTARRLQGMIRDALRLPCSLGGASNKLVAKIATNTGKDAVETDGWPNAVLVVPGGEEEVFLAPMSVRALWGVGPKTAQALEMAGYRTVGDIARARESDLEARLGSYGLKLRQFARGIDDRPVKPEGREAKSISSETTFARDLVDRNELHGVLMALSERVGRSLRDEGLVCRTVNLKLRWADFKTITRRVTLRESTNLDRGIYEASKTLFDKAFQVPRPIRLLGVGASGLDGYTRQMGLWDNGTAKVEKVQKAVDALRDRFGQGKATWGKQVRGNAGREAGEGRSAAEDVMGERREFHRD